MESQKDQLLKARNAELEKELSEKLLELKHKSQELEIEAALERVRAVAMSMMKSEDLLKVCESVFMQLKSLGFSDMELRNTQVVINNDEQGFYYGYQYSDYIGGEIAEVPYDLHPVIKMLNDELRLSNDAFARIVISGAPLDDWKNFVNNFPQRHDDKLNAASELYYYFYSVGIGALGISSFKSLTDDKLKILQRLRNVFNLSYQRYTDIKQAEAQMRESRVELALERVRARTMAMQKSDELSETSYVLFEQLKELGEVGEQISIAIVNEAERVMELYITMHGNQWTHSSKVELDKQIEIKKLYAAWKEQKKSLVIDLTGQALSDYNKFRAGRSGGRLTIDSLSQDRWVIHAAFFSKGLLSFSLNEPRPQETVQLLERFAGVFEGTYTRFLDLQKAEAQAREAKIEASLEKVRGKAMAMHSSSDLSATASTVFSELRKLGIHPVRTGVTLLTKNSDAGMFYAGTSSDGIDELAVIGSIDMSTHPVLKMQYESWLKKENYFPDLSEEEQDSYYRALLSQPSVPIKAGEILRGRYGYYFPFNEGLFYAWTQSPFSENEINILNRFKAIIDLTFRRYLDLQKAEAQAREAKIEAALERVRSKAMAMHKSDDLNDAVAIVFDELEKLSLGMIRCGIGILSKEKRCADVWTTTIAEQGRIVQVSGDEAIDIHPLLKGAYDAWLRQGESSYVLQGDDMSEYYKAVSRTNFKLPQSQSKIEHEKDLRQYYYACSFESGNLFAFRETDFSEEAKSVMKRFAGVFNLTYKRFLDIQKAEAQAREAQIEVALERVRSRTLAMQRSDELAETAAVLFRQLIILGIEPNRLYIGIIKDDNGDIEAWATDENGGKVSTMFILNAERNASVKKMFEGWREQKKTITIDMQGQELKDYFRYLSEDLKVPFKLGLSQKRRVQNMAYFSKGFIGLASPEVQPNSTTNLLERFAGVFNLTYTRFNDLQIAEQHAEQARHDLIKLQTEKKRAENALTELRATQAQLIQSEKMASLGELTAGIAHEIKNPLNFVNNFSELSAGLVDDFVNTNDESERKDIAEDLKKNLFIINEHGKRADSIVKNMLEHSRTGTGKKQLTDINQLCEEFFSLAYHGNRANIPDFNCEMKKTLAPDLPQINVVSQDISRVLLNLFNNAFYAVNEKNTKLKPQSSKMKNEYKPTVELITKLSNHQITISVKDNANGIPKRIKEKIFEPFFTTKPAGQGTGLGLSLSYDIITKGHGGELKVETKEGEGSVFIILLPV